MFGTGSPSAARRRGPEEKARTHAVDREVEPRERLPPSRSRVRVAAIAKTQLLRSWMKPCSGALVTMFEVGCGWLGAAARDRYITQGHHVTVPRQSARVANQRGGPGNASAASQGSFFSILFSSGLFHQTPLPAPFFAPGAQTSFLVVDILFPRPFSLSFPFFLDRIPCGVLFFARLHRPCVELPVHRLAYHRQSCRIATRLTQSSMMTMSSGECSLLLKTAKCELTFEFYSPLCIEEFDLSDKNFKPCPCGYQVSFLVTCCLLSHTTCMLTRFPHQICQFCYNNIKTHNEEGRCPNCRRPYDDSTIQYKVPDADEYVAGRRKYSTRGY